MSTEDHQKTVAERTPLGRVGQPEEVSAVIAVAHCHSCPWSRVWLRRPAHDLGR
ncbi:hypothetical protein [Nocardia amamiensis]|uniref:hypothetical protein n=1 Tax=Nocardia amamiensis TaxID=404578 RepID=UPI000B2CCC12|nr:hypothetical protein [Nocardia amamiensis]